MKILRRIRRSILGLGEPQEFTEEDLRGMLQRHRDEARTCVRFDESPCLTDDQLKAWSNRAFSKGASNQQVSEHLAGCRACADRLFELRKAAGWHPDKPIKLR